jgi:phosphatidylserine/phosphatidylglycerophosphate/cardiolipin synthase-like enzyme
VNVEVRLHDSITLRNARVLDFLVDFTRVNHRMRN